MTQNWTKEEFKTYVLLYVAQSNYIETEDERKFILSKVDEKSFNAIHTEIVHDNENKSMKKIKEYLTENKFSESDKENLIREIKEVCFADGSVDIFEKKTFMFLKKILK